MNIVAKSLISFFAVIVAVAACADGIADYAGLPDWENLYVTSSNRLPARAVFVPASSLEEAVDIAYLSKPRTASKWVMSLDGEGDFEWQPWTMDEIAKARHNEELPPSTGVTLVVDAAIMGVGGDDSWSRIAAPCPPHQPPPGRTHSHWS